MTSKRATLKDRQRGLHLYTGSVLCTFQTSRPLFPASSKKQNTEEHVFSSSQWQKAFSQNPVHFVHTVKIFFFHLTNLLYHWQVRCTYETNAPPSLVTVGKKNWTQFTAACTCKPSLSILNWHFSCEAYRCLRLSLSLFFFLPSGVECSVSATSSPHQAFYTSPHVPTFGIAREVRSAGWSHQCVSWPSV